MRSWRSASGPEDDREQRGRGGPRRGASSPRFDRPSPDDDPYGWTTVQSPPPSPQADQPWRAGGPDRPGGRGFDHDQGQPDRPARRGFDPDQGQPGRRGPDPGRPGPPGDFGRPGPGPDFRRPGPDVRGPAGPPGRRGGQGEGPRGAGPDDGSDEIPIPPVRRLVSLAVAAFAALLTFGLVFGANTSPEAYAVVVFGVQIIFTVVWVIAARPPAARVAAGVGLATAVVADIGAVWPRHPSLAPLGYAVAAGFLFGVIGQLARPAGRVRVTESLSTTLVVVLGVVAYASLVVLARQPAGAPAVMAGLVAAGSAIVLARLCDVVIASPRVAAQVPRGVVGVVGGAMAGTAAAAVLGSLLVGLTARDAAYMGLAAAVIAVLVDLAVAYADAGRRLEGEEPVLWLVRHMQGPLVGLALAAPVVYLLSALLLLPALG